MTYNDRKIYSSEGKNIQKGLYLFFNRYWKNSAISKVFEAVNVYIYLGMELHIYVYVDGYDHSTLKPTVRFMYITTVH